MLYLEPGEGKSERHEHGKVELGNKCYCNLRYGFECDQGWAAIIRKFSETATNIVAKLRSSGLQTDAWIRASIFKEKFASLRWQGYDNLIPPFHKRFFAYARFISDKFSHICERCGAPGKLRKIGGWYTTLRDADYQNEFARRYSQEA